MSKLLCTNKACGKEYVEEENSDEACLHHPGGPIFHEGLKGWSCCPKRFTDFTDFLGYKGCTKGRHTDAKPAAPAAAAPEPLRAPIPLAEKKSEGPQRSTKAKRDLPLTVTAALQAALDKQRAEALKEEESQPIRIGQSCTRNACKGSYQGPETTAEPCVHHPGAPVFHEGMKYWSCCDKVRTHDFDEFLGFPGCTTATHRWVRPKEETATMKECRHDWFQSGSHVVLSVFAKNIDPERSSVKANEDSITVSLHYERELKFVLELHLAGSIVPEECTVTLLSTKVDVKMKKGEDKAWPQLTFKE